MKMMMKNKPAGYYVSCVSAAAGLLTGILLLIYGGLVDDFYAVPPCLMILGAVLLGIGLAKSIDWLAILPGCCYIASFALYLSSQLDNIAGRIGSNGIGVTGTTLNALFRFFALMLFAVLLAVIASFMRQRKEER